MNWVYIWSQRTVRLNCPLGLNAALFVWICASAAIRLDKLMLFLVLLLQRTHYKRDPESLVWKRWTTFVSRLLFTLLSFPELFIQTASRSPTSHCISCHLLALLLHPSPLHILFTSPRLSAHSFTIHLVFLEWHMKPPSVVRSSFFLHQSFFLQRLNEAETSVAGGPGQFEGWFKIMKRRSSRAHCCSRLQHGRNGTPAGLACTRWYGSVW